MIALEHGRSERKGLERIREEISGLGERFVFDPSRLLVHEKVRLHGMSQDESRDLWMRELALPLLCAVGSEKKTMLAYRDFMIGHCERAL